MTFRWNILNTFNFFFTFSLVSKKTQWHRRLIHSTVLQISKKLWIYKSVNFRFVPPHRQLPAMTFDFSEILIALCFTFASHTCFMFYVIQFSIGVTSRHEVSLITFSIKSVLMTNRWRFQFLEAFYKKHALS